MDTNDELKEINIKNRTYYHFDNIIKIEDFNLDNSLTLIWVLGVILPPVDFPLITQKR